MHDSQSYKNVRKDIARYVKNPKNILDLGCNDGATARWLKEKFPQVKILGIEINEAVLKQAMPHLDGGWAIDLDQFDLLEARLKDYEFDYILAGDVLEHTWNFRKITGILYKSLKPEGQLIISVPNYGHWYTIYNVFSQRWPRNERGIFDKTHKTPFMRRNLKEFLANCPDGTFTLNRRNLRFFETNKMWKLNMLITWLFSPIILIPYIRNFFTLNFVFSIAKPK